MPKTKVSELQMSNRTLSEFPAKSFNETTAKSGGLRLGVAARIAIGFGSILVMLLGLGVTSFMALKSIEQSVTGLSDGLKANAVERQFTDLFLTMRRFAREYAIAGHARDLEGAKKAQARLQKVIDEDLDTVQNAKHREAEQALAADIADYMAGMERMFSLRKDELTLNRDVLDPVGLQLRKELDQLMRAAHKAGAATLQLEAADAIQSLMRLRLNINKLLDARDVSHTERAKTAREDLTKNFARLDELSAETVAPRSFPAPKPHGTCIAAQQTAPWNSRSRLMISSTAV